MTVEIVAHGLGFPEGPIAMADGSVLLVEVLAGRLSRVAPDGSISVVAELGGGPNGAAIGPDGRCYVCNNGGFSPSASAEMLLPQEAPFDTPPGSIQVVDLETGAFETLYAHSEETPFWGPNDLVFDDAGGFWFSDHGRGRGRIRQNGSLYYAKADGSAIAEIRTGIHSANGVGLSPDGSMLYVADTFTAHLWSFRLSAPGEIDRSAGHFPHGGSIVGRGGPGQYLDSLAVDSHGRICVASPGGGVLLVFSPEGGTAEAITMPDFLPTNICFGGPDLRTAYVTLGSTGQLAKVAWPVPGLKLTFG